MIEQPIMVSIIMPVYNAQDTLADAIDAIMRQTYQRFVLIVVNDGSDDDSEEIILKYQSQYGDKIQYLKQKNQGQAVGRNHGLLRCQTRYVAFCDSDDTWLPNKLENQMAFIREHPDVHFLATGRIKIDPTINKTIRTEAREPVTTYTYIDLWKISNPVVTSSVLCTRDCLQDAGLFDEAPQALGAEDWDLWLRVAEQHDVYILNEPLVRYTVSFQGHSRSSIERAYESSRYVLNKNKPELQKRCQEHHSILKNKFYNFYWKWGLTLLNLNRIKEAHKKFVEAIKIDPFKWEPYVYYVCTFGDRRLIDWIRSLKKKNTIPSPSKEMSAK